MGTSDEPDIILGAGGGYVKGRDQGLAGGRKAHVGTAAPGCPSSEARLAALLRRRSQRSGEELRLAALGWTAGAAIPTFPDGPPRLGASLKVRGLLLDFRRCRRHRRSRADCGQVSHRHPAL